MAEENRDKGKKEIKKRKVKEEKREKKCFTEEGKLKKRRRIGRNDEDFGQRKRERL